jgi:hypothetical protein
MGARNIDDSYTESLDGIVVALCRDFQRREDAVKGKLCSRRTAMEYEYINSRLVEAARELVGDSAAIYIYEIGERVGYAYSNIDYTSESTYKNVKKEIKRNIAKKLHMID